MTNIFHSERVEVTFDALHVTCHLSKIQHGVVLVSRFVHDWSRLSCYWRCICTGSYYGNKPQAVHSTQQKTKEVQAGFGCGIHCYDCANGKNATPLHFLESEWRLTHW